MDRLTFDGNFCDIARCQELPCPYDGSCSQKKVWERLKEYEDSGISPQAYRQAREIEEGLSDVGYSISRMVELMKADKDGKLIVLPCKREDELWTYCTYPSTSVYSFVVSDISWLNGRLMLNTSRCGVLDAREIGKTVFLTRKEAVNALESRKSTE